MNDSEVSLQNTPVSTRSENESETTLSSEQKITRYRELVKQKKEFSSGEKSNYSQSSHTTNETLLTTNCDTPANNKYEENAQTNEMKENEIDPLALHESEFSSQSSAWAMVGDMEESFPDSFDHVLNEKNDDDLTSNDLRYSNKEENLMFYLGNSYLYPLSEGSDHGNDSIGTAGLQNDFNAEVSHTNIHVSRFQPENQDEGEIETCGSESQISSVLNDSLNLDKESEFSKTSEKSRERNKRQSSFDEMNSNESSPLLEENDIVSNTKMYHSMESITASNVVSDSESSNSRSDSLSVSRVISLIDVYSSDFDMSPITPRTAPRCTKRAYYSADRRSELIQKIAESATKKTSSATKTPTSAMGSKMDHLTPNRMSLLERNKTLVKEVRFADQTCVELSEKNKFLENENLRLKSKLHHIKQENESLHNAVVRSAKHSASSESKLDILSARFEEQKGRHELQLSSAINSLDECKKQISCLTEQIDWLKTNKTSQENKLAISNDQQNQVASELVESKKIITQLLQRLINRNGETQYDKAGAVNSNHNELLSDMEAVKNLFDNSYNQLTSYVDENLKDNDGNEIGNSASNEALLNALDEAMNETRHLKATVAILKDEINEKKEQSEMYYKNEKQVKELTALNDDVISQLRNKEEEIHNLRDNVSLLENDIEKMSKDFDENQIQYERNIELLKKDNYEQNRYNQSNLHEVQKSKDSLFQELKVKEDCIESMKEERDNKLNESKIKIKSLLRKCSGMKEYISKLTIKCEEWAESYRNLSKDLSSANRGKHNAMQKLTDCMNQIQAYSAELRNYNSHGESVNCEECKYLRRAIATEGKKIAQLRNELEKQKKDAQKLKRSLKKRTIHNSKLFSPATSKSKDIMVLRDYDENISQKPPNSQVV